jgi:hypothetical protein
MHKLFCAELPDAEGNPRRRPVGTQEVLPQRAQAHRAQGIEEEVAMGNKRLAISKTVIGLSLIAES